MNIWHDLSPKRVKPEDFVALIEIPKGQLLPSLYKNKCRCLITSTLI